VTSHDHGISDDPALVSGYGFHLPPELIAQQPPRARDAARMMLLDRSTGALSDSRFIELPHLLHPGDLLVLNDSRVIPARLYATRQGRDSQNQKPSGVVEVMLAAQISDLEWTALVHPGRKVLPGERLFFAAPGADPNAPPLLEAEVIARADFGERTLRFSPVPDFFAILDRIGHIPLPPYIHRDDAPSDRDRYQTVYAAQQGSAAAPTAGLHFTPATLDSLRDRGVELASVTLHVGLGTFQPVRVARLDDIRLHAERYTLSAATADAINRARRDRRRIVAAGTTTVRTLEHCALTSPTPDLQPHTGETSIFIRPGHQFRVVNALLTNFHLPHSTLLMLVAAFAGYGNIRAAYAHAVADRYRFFSYGDCMFIA